MKAGEIGFCVAKDRGNGGGFGGRRVLQGEIYGFGVGADMKGDEEFFFVGFAEKDKSGIVGQ